MSKNNVEKQRQALKEGGPNYRATDYGKGDVDRARNRNAYSLGLDLIEAAKEYGNDSEEYKHIYQLWREAIKNSK